MSEETKPPTDEQINLAAGIVISCETGLGDPWRCDFCEPDCDCDERRREEALEKIMEVLGVTYLEADAFYDQYSY